MTTWTILGDGALGRATAEAAFRRGDDARLIGRPRPGGHEPAAFAGADIVLDASRPDAVASNVEAALDAGVRRLVIATTGWDGDRTRIDVRLLDAGASAVSAPNFSLGVALFGRLVESATALFGAVEGFDPFVVEWHRRGKRDRPSGTARDLARRMAAADPIFAGPDDLEVVSIRAGASPGMHLVGFDAAGETVELRLTARDRSAYAAGILAAADWLERGRARPGLHGFDPIVDDLLATTTHRPAAA